ncbi:MAG: hypothetical protein ACYSVY_24755, partial [Planctomycetota bacterium]
KLTVSSLSSGNVWEARVGYTTDQLDRTGITGTSSGLTYSIAPISAGGTVYAQVRATQAGRISSAWSTEATLTTSSLASPTAIATSSVTGNEAVISYAVGETAYPVEMLLDLSSTCPSSGGQVVATLPAATGTAEHKLTQLTLDSTHCVSVRHRDIYGGFGGSDSTSFETSTDPTDAPAIDGLDIVAGIK